MNIWLQYEKNEYIDKLDATVNKYNKTNHITIKMTAADVKSSADKP